MNNQRRKKLTQAYEYIQKAYSLIDEAMSEEEDAMNNLPESLQDTERYYEMEECVSSLSSALEALDDADVDQYLSEYRLPTAEEKAADKQAKLEQEKEGDPAQPKILLLK
ncbi:MAG: hypothetical protein MJZ16_04795 [Bacteroidales bacterium]|nr:hypothetical protein [Bacteroidales bacterium]